MSYFVTRCDSCGRCLYDHDRYYKVKLGTADLDVCDRCVIPIEPNDEDETPDCAV